MWGEGGFCPICKIYWGGDSVLVNKKEWGGGFCPGGILSGYPSTPPPLKINSFIYLSILGQFTSLLRSFSSYETSQSVGEVKTGEPRENKGKKPGISSSRTCLT